MAPVARERIRQQRDAPTDAGSGAAPTTHRAGHTPREPLLRAANGRVS